MTSTHTTMGIEMYQCVCAHCGIPFAFPQRIESQRREDGQEFYCPNGHTQYFGEGELDRLNKVLQGERAKRRRAQQGLEDERVDHGATKNKLRATKGVVTRLKHKASEGVCPCCDSVFMNLKQHMESEHPEWDPESEDSSKDPAPPGQAGRQ